ncbi:MAG: hypothetical protein M3342_11365 [Bacteroidota bacterium]|nr:hypothetical protein [Bacteroidota bacterium]
MKQSNELYDELNDSGDYIRIVPERLIAPNVALYWDRNRIDSVAMVKSRIFSGQYCSPPDFI